MMLFFQALVADGIPPPQPEGTVVNSSLAAAAPWEPQQVL